MTTPIPLIPMAAAEKIWEEEIVTVRGAIAELVIIGQEWDYGWICIVSQNLRGENNYLDVGAVHVLVGDPGGEMGMTKAASLTLNLGLSLPLIMSGYEWSEEKQRFQSRSYSIAFKPRSISARYRLSVYCTGEL